MIIERKEKERQSNLQRWREHFDRWQEGWASTERWQLEATVQHEIRSRWRHDTRAPEAASDDEGSWVRPPHERCWSTLSWERERQPVERADARLASELTLLPRHCYYCYSLPLGRPRRKFYFDRNCYCYCYWCYCWIPFRNEDDFNVEMDDIGHLHDETVVDPSSTTTEINRPVADDLEGASS